VTVSYKDHKFEELKLPDGTSSGKCNAKKGLSVMQSIFSNYQLMATNFALQLDLN
jgi:hypothetical protein